MKSMTSDERKNEIERDEATRFSGEQYIGRGYYVHFHRAIEIYGVVKGTVMVNIAGESMRLTDGQIAVVEGMANHSYEIDGEAEIFYFHIGTRYLRTFHSLYPKQTIPRWLMDSDYNKILYKRVRKMIAIPQEKMTELKKVGLACQLVSDIVEHYGTANQDGSEKGDDDMVAHVVQYIYEHYQENINLSTLSKVFYISPKALSKKISKRLNVDLRVFINDIRVQKAVEMIDDPANQGKSLSDIATKCGFNNMGTFYRSYERNFKFHKLGEK